MTGMLGLQTSMTKAQTFVYVIYLVPMLTYVLRPDGWRLSALTGRHSSAREPHADSGHSPSPRNRRRLSFLIWFLGSQPVEVKRGPPVGIGFLSFVHGGWVLLLPPF